MDDVAEAKAALTPKPQSPISIKDMLSSGSTLLNLACSGRIRGCFVKGKYYLYVGDSSSGKTFLALTCLAEATINPEFDGYRLIYDNVEDGALMSMEKFFGRRVAERLRPPAGTKDEPRFSRTVKDLYFHIDDANKKGVPYIYVLDSMDGLGTEEDAEKFQEEKKAARKGKEVAGSYGMSKAKANSNYLHEALAGARDLGSIIIFISQTRDNIGFGSQFNPKTRSGGKSLKFYATLEIWTSVKEHIKWSVKGKNREVGIVSKVEVKKNRVNGRNRTVFVDLYHSSGIDDLGSCIAYLIEEGHWKGSDTKVRAPEFDWDGSIEGLVHSIEEEEREGELRKLVGQVWNDIEAKCEVKRKSRYE